MLFKLRSQNLHEDKILVNLIAKIKTKIHNIG